GDGRGVGGGLGRAIDAIPRADVQDERCHTEQHHQEHEGDNRRLAVVVANLHSTRSVVELEMRPDFTTKPRRLIAYGYVALTVTSAAGCHVEVTVTFRSLCLRSLAEARTSAATAPAGFCCSRPTAPLRAPARVASTLVT